jgi:hypothetical protein
MPVTTDFNVWLEENEPSSIDDIYTLYKTVEEAESQGIWEISKNTSGRLFLGGWDSTLMLSSPEAVAAFLRRVKELTCEPDMDIESWYIMKTAP